jgi:hypothetical protein
MEWVRPRSNLTTRGKISNSSRMEEGKLAQFWGIDSKLKESRRQEFNLFTDPKRSL